MKADVGVERALTSPADPFSEANFSAEKLDSRVGSRGSGFLHHRPSGGARRFVCYSIGTFAQQTAIAMNK
eukprot:scaffold2584_cov141-Skeletonema_menzelii.AAC.9